jgi:hypothetical protein
MNNRGIGTMGLAGNFNDLSATDKPDAMTATEYEVAFAKMAQDYFSDKKSQDKPKLFYVTGLPGAGKSSFVSKAKVKDCITVNFDDLRIYHPRYETHVQSDPVNAAARIDNAVETLIGWLCEEAARRKVNIILDDAAMGAEMTKIVLSPFQGNAYNITAIVLSVPALVARQSVHLRFEENFAAAAKGKQVLPRWVNSTEQENAPAALVETVETLEQGSLAGRLIIMGRDHVPVYSSDAHSRECLAGEVMKEGLSRELTADETRVYQENAQRIAQLMNKRLQQEIAPKAAAKSLSPNNK